MLNKFIAKCSIFDSGCVKSHFRGLIHQQIMNFHTSCERHFHLLCKNLKKQRHFTVKFSFQIKNFNQHAILLLTSIQVTSNITRPDDCSKKVKQLPDGRFARKNIEQKKTITNTRIRTHTHSRQKLITQRVPLLTLPAELGERRAKSCQRIRLWRYLLASSSRKAYKIT